MDQPAPTNLTTVYVRIHPTLKFHARCGRGDLVRCASSRVSIVEAVRIAAGRYLDCPADQVDVQRVRRIGREHSGQYLAWQRTATA